MTVKRKSVAITDTNIPKSPGEITQELNNLGTAVNSITAEVEALAASIQDVLAPLPLTEDSPSPINGESKIGQEISGYAARLHALADYIKLIQSHVRI